MSLPSNFPLDIYHGDSGEWQFKLWLDTDKTQPMDLTGVIPKAEIRATSGAVPIYTLACSISTPNVVIVALSAFDSKNIPFAKYSWDLQLTFPTGAVNTIVAGAVNVVADITDSETPGAATVQAVPLRAVRKTR